MEPQFEADEHAQLTVLNATASTSPVPTRIVAFFGKRMTIAANVQVTIGSALKIETYRYIFMGRAVDVGQNGNILLHIHHALEKEEVDLLQRHWV